MTDIIERATCSRGHGNSRDANHARWAFCSCGEKLAWVPHLLESHCCGLTHKSGPGAARLLICGCCGEALKWGQPTGEPCWEQVGPEGRRDGEIWREFKHTDGDWIRISVRAANANWFCRETPFKPGVKLTVAEVGPPATVAPSRHLPVPLVAVAQLLLRKAADLLGEGQS